MQARGAGTRPVDDWCGWHPEEAGVGGYLDDCDLLAMRCVEVGPLPPAIMERLRGEFIETGERRDA